LGYGPLKLIARGSAAHFSTSAAQRGPPWLHSRSGLFVPAIGPAALCNGSSLPPYRQQLKMDLTRPMQGDRANPGLLTEAPVAGGQRRQSAPGRDPLPQPTRGIFRIQRTAPRALSPSKDNIFAHARRKVGLPGLVLYSRSSTFKVKNPVSSIDIPPRSILEYFCPSTQPTAFVSLSCAALPPGGSTMARCYPAAASQIFTWKAGCRPITNRGPSGASGISGRPSFCFHVQIPRGVHSGHAQISGFL